MREEKKAVHEYPPVRTKSVPITIRGPNPRPGAIKHKKGLRVAQILYVNTMSRPKSPRGKRDTPLTYKKYRPITHIIPNAIKPVPNAVRAFSGLSGKVPLPPLKGVLLVLKSNPLLKS